MTGGGGERVLRTVALGAWLLAWAWLILGLLLLGAWIAASVLVAALVGVWRVPAIEGYPRFEMQAAVSAMLGGVLWALGPWVGTLDPASGGAPWPWQAASALLLPVILVVRERERRDAPWLGALGWVIGWLIPFVVAGMAAGIGLPLTAPIASVYVTVGILLLPVAAVPFALVAAWSRAIRWAVAVALVAGAVAQAALGSPDVGEGSIRALGPAVFGAGWVALAADLLLSGRTARPPRV